MNLIARASVICVLAACGSPPPAATPPSPPPAPPAPPQPPQPPAGVDSTQLGSPCGEGQRCDAPATCVAYYGIAGPRGPEFKSCEVKCADDPGACPSDLRCVTIADGPGAVCRPDER